jgi:tetratricopeptide (TPR) repeat protein
VRLRNASIAILTAAALTLCAPGCGGGPRATHHIEAGNAAFEQQRYDEALGQAERGLAAESTGRSAAEALYLRGRTLEQRPKPNQSMAETDLREAARAYAEALKQTPEKELEAYIRTSLGNVAYWLNDYATAETQWQSAYPLLEDDNLRAWVLYRVGLSQQRQSRWMAADATFLAVQNTFPNTDPAKRAYEHQGARAFYVQIGAFANATSANQAIADVQQQGFKANRATKGELQRILVGPYVDYNHAVAAREKLLPSYRDAVIVP